MKGWFQRQHKRHTDDIQDKMRIPIIKANCIYVEWAAHLVFNKND